MKIQLYAPGAILLAFMATAQSFDNSGKYAHEIT